MPFCVLLPQLSQGKTLDKKDNTSEKALEGLVLKSQDSPDVNFEVIKRMLIEDPCPWELSSNTHKS